jgi:hypothetical protein
MFPRLSLFSLSSTCLLYEPGEWDWVEITCIVVLVPTLWGDLALNQSPLAKQLRHLWLNERKHLVRWSFEQWLFGLTTYLPRAAPARHSLIRNWPGYPGHHLPVMSISLNHDLSQFDDQSQLHTLDNQPQTILRYLNLDSLLGIKICKGLNNRITRKPLHVRFTLHA